MSALTFGAGIWAFGQIVDRYATDGYGPARTMTEMLDLAASVDGLACLDINVPFADGISKASELAGALAERGLRARAITPHLYTREFVKGLSPTPIRRCAAGPPSACTRPSPWHESWAPTT